MSWNPGCALSELDHILQEFVGNILPLLQSDEKQFPASKVMDHLQQLIKTSSLPHQAILNQLGIYELGDGIVVIDVPRLHTLFHQQKTLIRKSFREIGYFDASDNENVLLQTQLRSRFPEMTDSLLRSLTFLKHQNDINDNADPTWDHLPFKLGPSPNDEYDQS